MRNAVRIAAQIDHGGVAGGGHGRGAHSRRPEWWHGRGRCDRRGGTSRTSRGGIKKHAPDDGD